MWPASPKTSSLPILHLLLLLLAQHTVQAQGLPSPTQNYYNLIKEMKAILNEPPVPSEDPLESNEKFILRTKAFLRINLDEFLKATKDLQDRGEKIRKILEPFRTVLPTPTSTEDPIYIKKDNWGDFRRKLHEYLIALKNAL